MPKDLAIVDKVIELTNSNKIDWKNYHDYRPKKTLDALNFARVKILTKYPKKVLLLSDGYNKYQSYYALKDELVLALTKGKRDDRLLLIVGEVNPRKEKHNLVKHYKRSEFDIHLAVFTNEESEGKLSDLHAMIHQIPEEQSFKGSDIMDRLEEV